MFIKHVEADNWEELGKKIQKELDGIIHADKRVVKIEYVYDPSITTVEKRDVPNESCGHITQTISFAGKFCASILFKRVSDD